MSFDAHLEISYCCTDRHLRHSMFLLSIVDTGKVAWQFFKHEVELWRCHSALCKNVCTYCITVNILSAVDVGSEEDGE